MNGTPCTTCKSNNTYEIDFSIPGEQVKKLGNYCHDCKTTIIHNTLDVQRFLYKKYQQTYGTPVANEQCRQSIAQTTL